MSAPSPSPTPGSLRPPSRIWRRPSAPASSGANVHGPDHAAEDGPARGDLAGHPTVDESFSRLRFESPVHRAGLLQPRSFTPSNPSQEPLFGAVPESHAPSVHDQDAIRTHTMQLSYMQFTPSQSHSVPPPGSLRLPPLPASPPSAEPASSSPPHGDKKQHKIFDARIASAEQSHVAPSLGQSGNTDHDLVGFVPNLEVSTAEWASPPPLDQAAAIHAPISFARRADSRSRSHSPGPSGLSRLRREYEASPGASKAASRSPSIAKSPSPSEAGTSISALATAASRKSPQNGLGKPTPPSVATIKATEGRPCPNHSHGHERGNGSGGGHATSKVHWNAGEPDSRGATEQTPLLLNGHNQNHNHNRYHNHGASEITRGSLITKIKAYLGLGKRFGLPQSHPGHGKPGAGAGLTHGLLDFFGVPSDGGAVKGLVKATGKAVPAVVLGLLLNVLDGVSYGMILFPPAAPFSALGPMGVSLFFLTCVISQVIYTFGGCGFAGGNGSMMIEVVPFFHILATSIAQEIGEENERAVIATTLVAYALSSVLTGTTFLLLGVCKLGSLIGFFPRHILVGCIGGVGIFLVVTGFTVSLRMTDDADVVEIAMAMFENAHAVVMWSIPLGLAVLLRVITSFWRHQLVFPLYFIVVPMVFYFVVVSGRMDMGMLRKTGWVFDVDMSDGRQWWSFYEYFDLQYIHFAPLWKTLPTQFALLFFNILHPPLNVPALSVSLDQDIDTNKELVAHGYSNLAAGFLGTVPNYLVYVNTLLFYRVGGETRFAGLLLAITTAGLMVAGTGPIAFIPVMVVGALIFCLGLDLIKEALWDTRHRVNRSEYITIVSIMVCMTVWDFVIGVLFGIIASCFFFVVQNSQRRSIRALHTGETAMSTVRRPSVQRAYLREVSKQTTILQLQGFLFFGTITHVEETIRGLIEGPSWQRNPVQFLVLDLTLVAGVDMSAAEAFVRLQRLLCAKHVALVFCGFEVESPIGRALGNVEVLGMSGVELFRSVNDALEWTENAYLRAWFRSQKAEALVANYALPGRQDADIEYQRDQVGSLVGSPRQSHLRDVGNRTIVNELRQHMETSTHTEPHNTLIRAFSSYTDINMDEFGPLERYLRRMSLPEDYVLWRQGDTPDGLYIIESGVLRATYRFGEHAKGVVEESMVAGTLAGELSALSGLERNATVAVERPAVVWKLAIEDLRKLEVEEPALARTFVSLVLKTAKIDYDILLSALASRH